MLLVSVFILFQTVLFGSVEGTCYYGTAFKNVSGCFQFFRTPLNFTNALRFCRVNLKATLVRPTSTTKNNQIQAAANLMGIEEYWIGASNVDNDWEWLDGSQMMYANFDVLGGYPKKTESQVGAVSMDSLSGLWYTKKDAMALPFVCEFDATDDYDQGILYRSPKTQSLKFPHGGEKAPILLVQSTDQSVLYPSVGPEMTEQETGERVYLKPIEVNLAGLSSAGLSGEPIVIMNPRMVRKKVKPVVVSETDTEVNRTLKENESSQDSLNVKATGQANGTSSSGTELTANSNSSRSREESESIRSKTINIQRG